MTITRCGTCGTYPGGTEWLVWNPLGDGHRCPDCRGTGIVQTGYGPETVEQTCPCSATPDVEPTDIDIAVANFAARIGI